MLVGPFLVLEKVPGLWPWPGEVEGRVLEEGRVVVMTLRTGTG